MYVPRHGDIVWIDFEPHAGHEQAKERPALVLSEEIYNRRLWLAIMCPITTSRKPYRADLDVPIPPGVEIRSKDLTRIIEIDGVIQADHIKSLELQKMLGGLTILRTFNCFVVIVTELKVSVGKSILSQD